MTANGKNAMGTCRRAPPGLYTVPDGLVRARSPRPYATLGWTRVSRWTPSPVRPLARFHCVGGGIRTPNGHSIPPPTRDCPRRGGLRQLCSRRARSA
ncbi:hypothetical protein C8T65DRAFT_641206, partial [Cerioporus squamosus]